MHSIYLAADEKMDPGPCGKNNPQNLQTLFEVRNNYKLDHMKRGMDILKDPRLFQEQAFTIKERQVLGIHGLLPPCVQTPEQQSFIVLQNFYRYNNDLDRYIYLMELQDRNEKLFYRVVTENAELMMPVIYTPTVGLACQKYGLIFRKPRGLFISIHDKGHIYDILCNWPEQDVKAIVVTDGERILGLGDLGSYGMGIPVGKLALYTACAGVQPHQCLPITLDVGTNNKELLEDPMYIGLRQTRVTGPEYEDFLDEFMRAATRKYGQNTLIQFEDFGNHNAFVLLQRYRDHYCTFNDDIQGTASVTLAGLIASVRITGKKLSEQTILFQGAGEAALGIANLAVMAMMEEGVSEEDAKDRIWMVDSRGLIVKDRPKGGLTSFKERYARQHEPIDALEDVVRSIKPTAIIGVAAVPGAFTKQLIEDMSSFNEHPIIFALSNPTSKAECTAEQAYQYSQGKCVFASGSPFKPVTLNGKMFFPGQGNNAYIFPGIALAVVACQLKTIPETIFLKAAQACAALVKDEHLAEGRVYIPLKQIQEASVFIAAKVAEFSYKNNLATYQPEPEDKEAFIRSQMYSVDYENFLPQTYDWPESKY